MYKKSEIYKKIYKDSQETTNLAYHLIDKHSDNQKNNSIALTWINNDYGKEIYSFDDLRDLSNKFANMLISMGVNKGDVVVLFIDNLPELYIGFIGGLKVGAVITYIAPDLNIKNLKTRLIDIKAKIILTTPILRNRLNKIIFELFELQHIVVVNRNTCNKYVLDVSDLDYYQEMNKNIPDFNIVETDKEDLAFINYISDGNDCLPLAVSHENLLNYYLVSNCVIKNSLGDVYFSNITIDRINFINFNICYPWINASNNLVIESEQVCKDILELVEKEKINVLCLDQNSKNILDSTNIFHNYVLKKNKTRLFNLISFDYHKTLLSNNHKTNNNYIFIESKLPNVFAFKIQGFQGNKGFLGHKMIGQEFIHHKLDINNEFGELWVDVHNSFNFYRYIKGNTIIKVENYFLGLVGSFDKKGNIYLDI